MTTAAAPQQPAGSKEAAVQQPVGSKEAAGLQQGGGSTAASRRLNKKQHCSTEALTAGCPGIPTGQSGPPSWPADEPHRWRRPRQHCEGAQHEGLVSKGWAERGATGVGARHASSAFRRGSRSRAALHVCAVVRCDARVRPGRPLSWAGEACHAQRGTSPGQAPTLYKTSTRRAGHQVAAQRAAAAQAALHSGRPSSRCHGGRQICIQDAVHEESLPLCRRHSGLACTRHVQFAGCRSGVW